MKEVEFRRTLLVNHLEHLAVTYAGMPRHALSKGNLDICEFGKHCLLGLFMCVIITVTVGVLLAGFADATIFWLMVALTPLQHEDISLIGFFGTAAAAFLVGFIVLKLLLEGLLWSLDYLDESKKERRWRRRERAPNLLQSMYSSWKNKVCFRIVVKESDDAA